MAEQHGGQPNPLQKTPLGLLGLMELKTQGRNPDRFGDVVLPVMDVSNHYGATILEWDGTINGSAATYGDSASVQVPTGFAWRLHAASAQLASGTPITHADGLACSLQIGNATVYVTVAYAETAFTTFAGVSAALTAAWAPSGTPLVLPPGTNVSAVLLRIPSAAVELSVRVLFEALPV